MVFKMAKCAVTANDSKGALHLYCVLMVLVTVATVCINAEAHSSRVSQFHKSVINSLMLDYRFFCRILLTII